MSLKRYTRLEYLKKKSLTISINSAELEELTRIILRAPSKKFKSHSFKEKNYLKRKTVKQKDVKIKPSLTKHRTELLKDANTL